MLGSDALLQAGGAETEREDEGREGRDDFLMFALLLKEGKSRFVGS
jgi:hypothetical protein